MHPSQVGRYRLMLRLQAEWRAGLFPLLEAASSAVLAGLYRLDEILAVGRQSHVWLASDLDSGRQVVVKHVAWSYHEPLRYNRALAFSLRRSLKDEYSALRASTTDHLPRPLALITAPALVPAAEASPVLSQNEVFLVEEFIAGGTLTEIALKNWSSLASAQREAQVRVVVREFVTFWRRLHAAGWHYGDVSSNNVLLEPMGRVRVVDAGSAVPAKDAVVLTGFTPAFMTPRLYVAAREGQPVPGSPAAVLPPLAKIAHFALTRREPLNGLLPDTTDVVMASYSRACRAALEAMLAVDERPDTWQQACDRIDLW